MPKIEDIEGIGPVYAKKLMEAGVHTTDDLLKVGATAKGRAGEEDRDRAQANLGVGEFSGSLQDQGCWAGVLGSA